MRTARLIVLPLACCLSVALGCAGTPPPEGTSAAGDGDAAASARATSTARATRPVPCPSDDEVACEAACAADDLESCVRLGGLYEFGNANVGTDTARARVALRRACDGGVARGCYYLGSSFEFAAPKDPAAAAALQKKGRGGMKAACDAGDPDACSIYADMHLTGEDAPKDPVAEQRYRDRALVLYGETCALGDGSGCFMSGGGFVSAKQGEKAVEALTKGCELRDAGACALLGACYDEGFGVAADAKKSRSLFERACKLGSKASCSRIAGGG